MNYDVTGSWFNEEVELVRDIASIIPKNCSILTFGFDAFYYLFLYDINYMELYYGKFWVPNINDMSYIQLMVEAEDITDIKSALSHLNIRYMLLPTSIKDSIYSRYQRFNELSNLFKILRETDSLLLIQSYGAWDLFLVVY